MLGRRGGLLGALLVAALAAILACAPAATAPAGSGAVPPTTATAAGSSADQAAAPPAPSRVVVSYSELVASELPLWIAQEAGIFRKNGLEVELQLIESATGLPALLAGETQIAQVGGSTVLGAAVGGADVLVVGVLAAVYPYVFQAHPSIRTVDDLRGQKVGVSRFGASSDSATRVSLRKLGLDAERDLTMIQVGSASARTAAMLSGAIQGAVAQPPDTMVLEAQGFNNLFDLAALELPASQVSVAVQRSYAASNHDVLQRYVDSLVEAGTVERRDKAFSVQVLKTYLRSDDEAALGVTYDYYANKVLAVLPHARAEQFADALEQLGEKNERARDFDVQRMLDSSFVQSAADRGLAR
jgi:NitT/TauT family transport system substrate-binding protein